MWENNQPLQDLFHMEGKPEDLSLLPVTHMVEGQTGSSCYPLAPQTHAITHSPYT